MSSFFQQNKVAVAVTAVLGVGTLAGIVYYLNKQSSESTPTTSSSVKKNKKKKKNSKSGSSDFKVKQDTDAAIYPIDETTKLPKITDEIVASLSEEQKEAWALALKEKGNEYFKAKQYETAIVYYSAALKCKKDHIFYGNRSACYYALNDTEKTIEDATKALEIKPDYSKCLLRRAHVYEDIGRYEDAMLDLTSLSIFSGLADKSSDSVLERVLVKQANKMNEENYSDLPKELPSSSSINSFLGAFVKEDIDLDESKYEADSGYLFLIKALNAINLDTDEGYESADTYLNQAVERFEKLDINSLTPEQKNLVAIAYEYLGIFAFMKTLKNAKDYVEKAISISPRPRMYVVLALIAADNGDYITADLEFTKAIKMNPEDPNIYYHYAQVYYLMGDLTKAQSNFEKAKTLNPDNVYSYIQLACITYRQNDINQCLKKFNQAKALFPTCPEIPNYYGEILFDKGDIEGASKQFDVAIKLQKALPGNNIGVLPLINKSVVFQKENDFAKCQTILEEAVKIDPKSEVAWTNLGQTYLMMQNYPSAMECFEKASYLCRTAEDRKQTLALYESAKIQEKIRQDPVLSKKMHEIIAQYSQQAMQM
ncbi:hypothetical protein CANINC_001461 [Pichia inconspicua]|uniref:Mitochondrial import receptor subunit TOM70 n=1 Tax=Pichia inconspicua TaxID=52247 RepID=A0A4V4NFY9_9ASCO|nr:hypothetical protein CANINC_001461 [[Candida] inconspicua]